MTNNLLTDPLFTMRGPSGREHRDFPGLLEALGEDRVESLPALQRHQEDPFHTFVCMLAASVLLLRAAEEPSQNAFFWREGIRLLSAADGGEDDCTWTLVVPDKFKPGFMQAPLPATGLSLSPKASTPDALDLLPTAKNHDVKSSRLTCSEPEDWVFALISLQTMSGVFGAGNYGICRMNGGYGSRAVASSNRSLTLGGRFREDVTRLLGHCGSLCQDPWPYKENGLHLLWVPTWDGQTSLPLAHLHPFFIEVCRLVRLAEEPGGIRAWGAATNAPRVAAKEQRGVVGDPWSPVKVDEKKGETALTVGPAGLSAQLLRGLLFEDGYRAAEMMRPQPEEEGPVEFTLSVLVRGQGTTDGFREARVRIPGKVRSRLFGRGAERDRLAELSREGLEQAATMERRVLKRAVFSLLEGGTEGAEIDWDKDQAVRCWEKTRQDFISKWSADFFSWLFEASSAKTDEAVLLDWIMTLENLALSSFSDAVAAFPRRRARSFRSRAMAEAEFRRALFRNFPQLTEVSHDLVNTRTTND